jgi:hypothetical protein
VDGLEFVSTIGSGSGIKAGSMSGEGFADGIDDFRQTIRLVDQAAAVGNLVSAA